MTSAASTASLIHPYEKLSGIDQLLLADHHVEAGNAVIALIFELGSGHWRAHDYNIESNHGSPLNVYGVVAERLGNQWRQVLLSDANLQQLNLGGLLHNIYQLHLILMGSYQGHMDDVILAQHLTHGDNYTPERLLRLLLAWCPASRMGIDIFQYFASAPELVLAHAMATVGGMALVSEVASEARNRAIDLLNNVQVADDVLVKFSPAGLLVAGCWMRCSYANHPNKHQVKKLLMRLSRLWLQAQYGALPKPEPVPLRVPKPDKPILVLPLESFYESHAMFRCYAPIIEALRSDFYLVGLAGNGRYDAAATELFDEFFDASDLLEGKPVYLGKLIASIKSWQPAALYYPSVGMMDWTLMLSMERLAPVQLMTLGHPATSLSPAMDYVLIEAGVVASNQQETQDCFSEKLIILPNHSTSFRLPPGAMRISPVDSLPEDGCIRIAIPSVAQKLSAGFIRCLRRVEKAGPDRVKFVFFLGEKSLQAVACLHQLRRELGHADFHLQLPYDDYIREINRCQIHACSFPFGGTNSLVDSLRQGLPLLALEGVEPHARIDASFIREVGLPESLICDSEEAYADRLISLIENPDELQRLRHYLLHEANVDKKLFQEGCPGNYVTAIDSLLDQGVVQ